MRVLAIDTDPGIDDALALMLALRSPEWRVELITTVAGNVPVDQGTANLRRLLRLIRPATPPAVARGAGGPLRRRLTTAQYIHGDDGLGGLTKVHRRNGQPTFPLSEDTRSSAAPTASWSSLRAVTAHDSPSSRWGL